MSEPNGPEQQDVESGPVDEPEFTEERIEEMAELSRRAELVEETTAPPDDEDGEQ